MRPSASVRLQIDGQPVPCLPQDLVQGRTTALAGLTVAWGRQSITEQPGPATCKFTLLDPHDGINARRASQGFLDLLHVGSTVDVWADGLIPITGPDHVETVDSPDLNAWPTGDAQANGYALITGLGSPRGDVLDRPEQDQHGRVLSISGDLRQAIGTPWNVTIPPRRFAQPGSTPDAWDSIPHYSNGDQPWLFSVNVLIPIGTSARLTLVGFSQPYPPGTVGQGFRSTDIIGNGQWQTLTGETWAATDAQDDWLGMMILIRDLAAMTWAKQLGTWDDHPETWQSWSEILIDNYSVKRPPTPIARSVLVFSGRISDLVVSPASHDALRIEVDAADLAAELSNRVIGDDPWPAQPLAARADRIRALAQLPADTLRIDAPLGDTIVSYRDVDAQPAQALLADLAQTAGGVLWSATHALTGPYLYLENPDLRAAVRRFALDPNTGQAAIINAGGAGKDDEITIISACDVQRDPITWVQSVSDVITTVIVGWLDQTIGEDGQPEPTERYTITTDDGAEDQFGRYRLSISTELTTAADATRLGGRLLALSSSIGWRVAGITYDTARMMREINSVSDAERETALLDLLDGTIRMGKAVTLIDLPTYSPRGSDASVYVEGGTYTYENAWALDLLVTPSAGQGQSASWSQFPTETWIWSVFDQQWLDAYGTAAPSKAA